MNMTLFVWSGRDVLVRYGSGRVFVLADSVEQARQLAYDALRAERLDVYLLVEGDEDSEGEFARLVAFLQREPDVYASPVAFPVWGSE